MLINCPECNKEISDQAETCPNCGYKLPKPEPTINGVYCPKCLYCGIKTSIKFCAYCDTRFKDSITGTCDEVDNYTKNHPELKESPEFSQEAYNKRIHYVPTEYYSPLSSTPHCPKCGSTAITTGARGVSGFWGFIGASKTVNRCGNCGYTWKPNGR